ncbi:MinD/ParA family protein [Sinomonas terrae]|uniref:MinD/ParA family protein n=1 Tax=Sinomonas terrae TaxID=2908838 RepID=A0ABS9TYK1_9MICC|nr:MinD/ParA family protein [Sinomonas terrae]MCH6469165.1 MinD/ParA family protein [Sinomonas terrae]
MADDGTQQRTDDDGASAPSAPPVPLTRRELRRLREAEEAAQAARAHDEVEPTLAQTGAPVAEPVLFEPAPVVPAPVEREPEPAPVEREQEPAPVEREQEPAPVEREQEPAPSPNPPAPSQTEQPAGFIKPSQAAPPRGGFRGWLYRLTGGALNLGPSPAEREEAELNRRIRRRLEGSRNTALLSMKGGVGKTSTTVGVGLTLASVRSGSVCAIDANPDAGDLIERALGEGAYESERQLTITRLLRELGDNDSRVALDAYLHEVRSLRLLAGEQDPDLSDSLRAEDYERVYSLVSRHYGVTLTDCGTGVSRPAMRGILEHADNIVVAAGFAVSGAKRARDTLLWLSAHGFEHLAKEAIVVVTDKDDVSARVDKAAIEAALAGMCRMLISVPHDKAVADGDLVSLEAVRPETRRAYKEIAAAIVDGYR